MFSFEQSKFDEVLGILHSIDDFASMEGESIGIEPYEARTESGNFKELNFEIESCEDSRNGLLQQELQSFLAPSVSDDFNYLLSPASQPSQEENAKLDRAQSEKFDSLKPQNERSSAFPLAPLQLLEKYGSRFRKLSGKKANVPEFDRKCASAGGCKLSAVDIMRLAGEKFIQSRNDDFMVVHPYSSSLLCLSSEEAKDVELVQYLLASAEKTGQKQFDCASRLLSWCDEFSSNTGNPVERLVYYFSTALQEKINRDTGKFTTKDIKKQSIDLDEEMRSPNPVIFACHRALPFAQLAHLAGMQTIIENLTNSERVHLIDLEIRNGVQCTVLMQALAARCDSLKLLKITAVGTKSREKLEETGKQLVCFAQSLNIPFSFKVVMVPEMLELTADLFELKSNEKVAVFSQFFLRTMLAKPNYLESLMRVIRKIKPCIMVLCEIEANLNSPVFATRFVESLFFYGAYFDCLEDCMKGDEPNRITIESVYFSLGIQTCVAAEGKERNLRDVEINVWRAFFKRFGMVETEFSMSSLYQARLVVEKFACRNSCTIDTNGNCLVIGWKGTPLHSLSAWKFL